MHYCRTEPNLQVYPTQFIPLVGQIIGIENFSEDGCVQMFELLHETGDTITQLIIYPNTYFVKQQRVLLGMPITAFYDSTRPVPLIYPPRMTAIAVSPNQPDRTVKLDRFDYNLISSDGTLQLEISYGTEICLPNGQLFTGSLENRDLLVIYGASTRSIPALTIPIQIVVLCWG